MTRFNHLKAVLAGMLMLVGGFKADAFVLIGQANSNEVVTFNYTEEMGAPKSIDRGVKRLFRWNIPYFTYSFDASFVNYFGQDGMNAAHEAFGVINDFFQNEDYEGVSQLDLARHGFLSNYNTTWINTTAQNAQIIDIKSLTLGMLVNQIGLGNPHRFAFTITGTNTNAWTTNSLTFQTQLRNYDPISNLPTEYINNVKYSYRLVHDATNITVGTRPQFGVADMEEFTTDTTGNAWTSVAGIADAFYGNTALFWTDTPTLFNFGVYYDGQNAMGGQFRPRHALTYDDAGGLKYLYQTNTYVYETLSSNVVLVEPATYLPPYLAIHFPRPDGRRFPIFPRRGVGAGSLRPTNTITSPWRGYPGMGTNAITLQNVALRGGVNKLQFYHQPFDSLLGFNFTPTNFVWTDTFIFQPTNTTTINVSDAGGRVIGTFNNRAPGLQWLTPNPNVDGAEFWLQPQYDYQFSQQKLGRNVSRPDFLLSADYLTNSADGVPIGWMRSTNGFIDNATNNISGFSNIGTNEIGPGIFNFPTNGAPLSQTDLIEYRFTKIDNNFFEVIWSGEASVVGNLERMPSLWGWIKGPGPNDFVTFPQGNTPARLQDTLVPDVTPPSISMVSDSGGLHPIEKNTITRTEETLTIIGTGLASASAIEILSGDLVLQTIIPADQYVVSNSRIDIPAGIITEEAEGPERQIRVWNTMGPSGKSVQKFTIETGRPMLASTDFDNSVYDRAQAITLRGYGFKSKSTGEEKIAWIRVDNSDGGSVDDNGTANGGAPTGQPKAIAIEVVDDKLAFLPLDSIKAVADGSNRRLRVSRKVETNVQDSAVHLSPGTNPMFTAITTKPVINALSQLQSDAVTWEGISTTGMYKRDRILEINGTALNTAQVLEVVMEDGTSFPNPVFIQLPNAGVVVEDNGTRIQVSSNAIPYPDADTNSSTAKRGFKVYNSVGNTDLNASLMFAVNKQPVVDAMGGFRIAGHFNRDKLLGDDVHIFGTGFQAVHSVIITDDTDTTNNRITIELPSPGITITDTQISIDTSTFQIGGDADTDLNSSRRRIKLRSARDNSTSPAAQRFYIGTPPTMGTFVGLSDGANLHYYRDNATFRVTGGTGYGHIQSVEIVDAVGNPIAGVPALLTGADGTGGTGLLATNSTGFSISANPVGWSTINHLLDAVGALDRRVKITTPFGVVTSSANATHAFTVSATPVLKTTAQATFAGGGYVGDLAGVDDANGTYDKSDGDLVINGENFRGVYKVYFGTSIAGTFTTLASGGNFTLNPTAPPQGFTFNVTGTQITIDDGTLPATWIGTNNATLRLQSVGGGNVTSAIIRTQE